VVLHHQLVEQIPPRCRNGHPWGPNLVLVGWLPCECRRSGGGHRTYQCRRCDMVIYRPVHDDGTAIQDRILDL
jgi:hypothetical protein